MARTPRSASPPPPARFGAPRRTFSERHGYVEVPALQTDDLDQRTRNRLFNVLSRVLHEESQMFSVGPRFLRLMDEHFKVLRSRTPPHVADAVQYVEDRFLRAEWHECLSIVEHLIEGHPKGTESINRVLEQEGVGYRVVGGLVVPLTEPEQIESIEQALSTAATGARAHIQKALDLLRPGEGGVVDAAAVVREAIHAVEAQAQAVGGKGTLGDLLRVIDKRRMLHPVFKTAVDKLYGWTSDEKGVRHAADDFETNVQTEDAILMVVLCSSFVTWLQRYA